MVVGAVVPCVAEVRLLDSVIGFPERVPETLLSGTLKPREATLTDGESFLIAAAIPCFSFPRHSFHSADIYLLL